MLKARYKTVDSIPMQGWVVHQLQSKRLTATVGIDPRPSQGMVLGVDIIGEEQMDGIIGTTEKKKENFGKVKSSVLEGIEERPLWTPEPLSA